MRSLLLASLSCLLAAQAPRETVSTLRDRQALAVTITSGNLALVRDQREVRLPRGDLDLAFEDVAALIRPETALLRNLTDPKDFWINEQYFDFDLLTPEKLLEKFVGRKVTVVTSRPNPDGPGAREVREEAEVLASNGGVVLQFPDRVETAAPGRIVYPEVPGNLRSRPTLVLGLHSAADRAQKLELTYLTGGMSWQADYVANLAPGEKTLDLAGWATLTNQSGTAYPGATLQLVAGNLHRVETPRRMLAAPMAKTRSEGAQMQEEGLFEYHLYTLARPTTLQQNQTKQVALLAARDVPVRKAFVLQGATRFFRERADETDDKVGVFLEFDNRTESSLGMPLPKGVVRVYLRDGAGRPQFIGEDAIGHTPQNGQVRLRLGDAFDVTARRRQTDFRNLGSQGQYHGVSESAFQIELKNAKPEPVTVTVLEPMQGDWEISQSSQPFTRENAGTARFLVTVPAQGAATLAYRAKVRW